MVQFTLLAHNCFCPSCARSARGQMPRPGRVCGHGNAAGQWSCVYCGGPVTRFTPWFASLYQSVRGWLGWVKWEAQLKWWGL